MPSPRITVAVPTLAADDTWQECLQSLDAQTFEEFDVVIVDNSGTGRVHWPGEKFRVISNPRNVGFGAAINQVYRASRSPYIATLNDDAVAHPGWLAGLVEFADSHPRAGMLASRVLLRGTGRLDSAGMLLASDGSSKQRGHDQPGFETGEEVLLPSGSAALYRREMLEEVGLFDESFFLYCEDTDLGLRARWAGWDCWYVPLAVVEHRYSHSAGRASPMKAYYVERNRLYMAVKNFPGSMLWRVPFASLARYWWHLTEMLAGRGKGAEFRQSGHSALLLPWLVLRAHGAALANFPSLWAERRNIRAQRKIGAAQFVQLAERHSISLRKVAAL